MKKKNDSPYCTRGLGLAKDKGNAKFRQQLPTFVTHIRKFCLRVAVGKVCVCVCECDILVFALGELQNR